MSLSQAGHGLLVIVGQLFKFLNKQKTHSKNSAEETTPQTTPQIPKRKRSSPSRVTSSVPEGIEQSKTARPTLAIPIPSIGQDDHLVRPAPILDQDDHLPIKKLKTQHSQGPDPHSQSSTQTPKLIP